MANNNTIIRHRFTTQFVENHLAEILSRNPAGLEVNEIQDLNKPNTILLNTINLDTDKPALRNLKNVVRQTEERPKAENSEGQIGKGSY
jgi:hypothetical protein